MAQRDVVVIGGSAGGVEALRTLVSGLPPSLAATVFVVLHLSPHAPSHLATILGKTSRLPVQPARDGLPLTPGRVIVAVPDSHLLVEKDRIRVTRGPRENRARPAIDALFRSAAYHFGPRVIGVVLTGNLDDGTAGLWAIKDRGGVALVQSPDDAAFPSMPASALRHVAVDRVLPVSALPAAIVEVMEQPAPASEPPEDPAMETETRIAGGEHALQLGSLRLGTLAPLTCPECHGSLVQLQQGSLLRFRCHVGHAFTAQALLAQLDEEIGGIFGRMVRAIEERILLLEQLAGQPETDPRMMADYARLAAESETWIQQLRALARGPRSTELSPDSITQEAEQNAESRDCADADGAPR